MSDEIRVEQHAAIGSGANLVGVQNNYSGLNVEDATRLFTNLFLDNFPRMQLIAKEAADARFQELKNEVFAQLQKENVQDYNSFADVDVQYALFEAQKNYARFGTEDMLNTLAKLIVGRVEHNSSDFCLKASIDRAIEIAALITPQQLDYLSLLFVCTRVVFSDIQTLDNLRAHFQILNQAFPNVNTKHNIYLNSLNCLIINIVDITKRFANRYGFSEADVETICPENIKQLDGDYSTSNIGTILAIVNLEAKTPFRFDPKIWIND